MATEPRRFIPAVGPRLVAALEFIVKVVAIAVPVLYTLGRIYAGAYWQQLRIPASLMEYSTEDFLYLGFVSIFSISARVFGVNAYSSFGYALLVAIAIAVITIVLGLLNHILGKLFSLPILKLVAHARRIRATKHEPLLRIGMFGLDLGASALFVASVAFFLVAFAILPIYFVLKEGRRHALSDLGQITAKSPAKDGDAASFAHLMIDGEERVFPLFQCAPKWCVLLIDGHLTAVPEQTVTRIDSAPLVSPPISAPQRGNSKTPGKNGAPPLLTPMPPH